MTSTTGTWIDDTAVLTASFGDPAWAAMLLRRLRAAFPEIPDRRIFVIDQDRTERSATALRDALGAVQILTFPTSPSHVAATGHDHAYVLNLAVRAIDTGFLMLFDSDAHPVSHAARTRLEPLAETVDAVLAGSASEGIETHPCFMLLGPEVPRDRLYFDAGQVESGVDTGREIGRQISALGRSMELLRPVPAFGGSWGTLYLERTIYHHGSGSFGGSADSRLRRQFSNRRREDAFFRRRVFDGRYELSEREAVASRALRSADRRRRKLATLVRRRILRRDPDPFDPGAA